MKKTANVVTGDRRVFLAAAISAALFLFASCSPKERVIENPLIDLANTSVIDITRVEITDTSTVLTVDAMYIPHYWITIDSGTYLYAGGKEYRMTGTEGIQADSLFWMPESGRAVFKVIFEPLPKKAKSFDFIETEWKLYGVDLTGKTAYGTPDGVPAALKKHDGTRPVPDPILESGETEVTVYLLNYRKELGTEIELYVNTLLNGQQSYKADIDPETATAGFRFQQYGPAYGMAVFQLGNIGGIGGEMWLAPGDSAEAYLDMRASGWMLKALRARNNAAAVPALGQRTYVSGEYMNLTNTFEAEQRQFNGNYVMNLYSGSFADYRMSADEYTEHVISRYRALTDSISASGLSPMMKEYWQTSLKQETVSAFGQGDFLRKHNYMMANNNWDYSIEVPGLDKMGPENYAALCGLFDVNDPKLLMGRNMLDFITAVTETGLSQAILETCGEGFIHDLTEAVPLAGKAENGDLSEAELEQFRSSASEPFFAEALEAMQADALASLAALEGKAVIEKTPEVSKEKLFDSIIAPHKGKVILVDFWNIWCGPCRAAISETEPLKDSELASEDLVWIYIANETSPIVKYKSMIPDIRGIHYRIGSEQWQYLCEKFGIDGIPSYVLVDKDGSYRLRNDFRDHGLMVSTLKEMTR
ncbi:MAG: TlpA family protein disulfide reductase [Bacteroidetes bacterium]|uniref:TlpA family protein disulfide reductase n=1 Tax=Candidatus Cryptobacteroides avicola TaxID=2840757 RepID=A0A940DSW6_9BACT|nr:TlpA family protein disulfide reductase [Candidatus Cryptobacteroides avicola]